MILRANRHLRRLPPISTLPCFCVDAFIPLQTRKRPRILPLIFGTLSIPFFYFLHDLLPRHCLPLRPFFNVYDLSYLSLAGWSLVHHGNVPWDGSALPFFNAFKNIQKKISLSGRTPFFHPISNQLHLPSVCRVFAIALVFERQLNG
jgi:hypothetical protein